jgi:hypothetical protein
MLFISAIQKSLLMTTISAFGESTISLIGYKIVLRLPLAQKPPVERKWLPGHR